MVIHHSDGVDAIIAHSSPYSSGGTHSRRLTHSRRTEYKANDRFGEVQKHSTFAPGMDFCECDLRVNEALVSM